ncbi:lambda-exonuclease family protein [Sandarakinorhabdus sp.]|uniref:lambda-exonuclease family protein n=1 Tax=Sandarakinorhabdus sp. TaxID=1916663 RepID=UPI00286E88C7|nr:YqaJ viral recombinase family protein [Sandarakinorhabdus sp.]
MSFETVDLPQNSAAWLRWRHDGIGASEAPALMGENPWKSAERLFREKAAPPPAGNWVAGGGTSGSSAGAGGGAGAGGAMGRGHALEPHARAHYVTATGIDVAALCVASQARPWQRASLDGICTVARRLVEIKCGDKVYALTEASGEVPGYYVGQLQHTLAVTGYDSIDFWVWLPGKPPLHLTVARDEDYIDRLNERGAAFWARVMAARAA